MGEKPLPTADVSGYQYVAAIGEGDGISESLTERLTAWYEMAVPTTLRDEIRSGQATITVEVRVATERSSPDEAELRKWGERICQVVRGIVGAEAALKVSPQPQGDKSWVIIEIPTYPVCASRDERITDA